MLEPNYAGLVASIKYIYTTEEATIFLKNIVRNVRADEREAIIKFVQEISDNDGDDYVTDTCRTIIAKIRERG
jgi:hypothetical protein